MHATGPLCIRVGGGGGGGGGGELGITSSHNDEDDGSLKRVDREVTWFEFVHCKKNKKTKTLLHQ